MVPMSLVLCIKSLVKRDLLGVSEGLVEAGVKIRHIFNL